MVMLKLVPLKSPTRRRYDMKSKIYALLMNLMLFGTIAFIANPQAAPEMAAKLYTIPIETTTETTTVTVTTTVVTNITVVIVEQSPINDSASQIWPTEEYDTFLNVSDVGLK